ncbi:hypothetical protein ACWGB8_12820 [Kitasatospora sp. NPDC054939]
MNPCAGGRREKAGPGRLECPQCTGGREAQELGLLVVPAPTRRELLAARVSAPRTGVSRTGYGTPGSTR